MNTGEHSTLKEELRNDAKSLGDAARSRVQSEMDGRKGVAAKQVKSAASALENAAGGLDDDSPEWLRSALRSGSQALQRMADSVEGKSSQELIGDVQRMARNNPALFLGLCAVAGFAAVRVMKASSTSGAGGGGTSWNRNGGGWDDNDGRVILRRTQDEPEENSDYREQASYGRAPLPPGADKLSKPQAEAESW